MNEISRRICAIIGDIPPGTVSTYGEIARMAGNPRGARTVSRILNSCSSKYNLPWHRVVNSRGRISLPGEGGRAQRRLLEEEGIKFAGGAVDLDMFLWRPERHGDLI